MKLCVIGGGTNFVTPIAHGLCSRLQAEGCAQAKLSLFDVDADRAQMMADYSNAVARHHGVDLTATVARQREEAIEGAGIVLLSVGLHRGHEVAQQAAERYGFPPHSIHDGPPSFATALEVYDFCRNLATAVLKHAPGALMLNLLNPTDLIADVVERATGQRCVGLCVEVEHLRDHLAYYFGYQPEQITLDCAGVNHDGWTLRLWIDGQPGYPLLHDGLLKLEERDDFHPGNTAMVRIYQMTGYLRSSAYHSWMYACDAPPGSDTRWASFGPSHEERIRSIQKTIQTGIPPEVSYAVHPEKSIVKYLGTGRALAAALWAVATGQPDVVPLQVRNHGAVSNLPDDVMVEVPVSVAGATLRPLAMGELPEALAGMTRLLAVQRKLAADYILNRRLSDLEMALMTLPTLAKTDAMKAYAEELHERYGRDRT